MDGCTQDCSKLERKIADHLVLGGDGCVQGGISVEAVRLTNLPCRAQEASQEDGAGAAKRRKLAAAATPTPVWKSQRPRMKECSEAQFMEDLCAFHRERNGKNVTPETFPDAILNGSRLDLYRLYKEVTTRGGIKCVAIFSETQFISHWNVLLMSLFSKRQPGRASLSLPGPVQVPVERAAHAICFKCQSKSASLSLPGPGLRRKCCTGRFVQAVV